MNAIMGVSRIEDGNMSYVFAQDKNDVTKNRTDFLENNLGVSPVSIYSMKPKHGTTIISVDNSYYLDGEFACDGIYTTNPRVALLLMPADCMPVFMWNDNVVALVHAGSAGILDGISYKMILRLVAEGLVDEYNKLDIAIGPHIQPCCYRFPVESYLWQWGYKFAPIVESGFFEVDLSRKHYHDLLLLSRYIDSYQEQDECTCCYGYDEEFGGEFEYFSHVRSSDPTRFAGDHPHGRNMAAIVKIEGGIRK